MNKPYQRDEMTQKQDFEKAKRDHAQAESERKEHDASAKPQRGADEEE